MSTTLRFAVLCALAVGIALRPCGADPASGIVLLDGHPVAGARYVVVDGRPYFPIVSLGEARGVPVVVGADGSVTVHGRVLAGSRAIDGRIYVPREALKQALSVTVYVDADSGRALLTSSRGVARARQSVRFPSSSGAPESHPPTVLWTPKPGNAPNGGAPGPAPGNPAGPGPPPGAPRPNNAPVARLVLEIFGVTVDRDLAASGHVRVRASARNVGDASLRGATVRLVLWNEGSPTAPDPVTGQEVCAQQAYSTYEAALPAMNPGEVHEIDIQTSVGSPKSIDASSRVIVLDVSRAFDPFAERRLKFGFAAVVTR